MEKCWTYMAINVVQNLWQRLDGSELSILRGTPIVHNSIISFCRFLRFIDMSCMPIKAGFVNVFVKFRVTRQTLSHKWLISTSWRINKRIIHDAFVGLVRWMQAHHTPFPLHRNIYHNQPNR
jgi:hypothetical protein